MGALLDLIRGLSKGWVALLDFDTLEKVSGSYVSDDLRDREDDISWRIRMHSTTSEGGWQQQGEWVDIWRSKAAWMPSCGAHAHYVSPLYPDLIKTKRQLLSIPTPHAGQAFLKKHGDRPAPDAIGRLNCTDLR